MRPTTPGSHQKNSTKIGLAYNCHRAKQSFDSSNKAKLRIFQNHRKRLKTNVVFHFFQHYVYRNHHDFQFFKSVNFCHETAD